MANPNPPRGRGTGENPENRFERVHVEHEVADGECLDPPQVPTLFFRDTSRTVLAENDSPDIPFRFSLNPYRGCEHGCIYCYARPSHEYLSFSAGLDFETRVMVKEDAPELLRQALLAPSWQPQIVSLSGNTDCYQPVERSLGLTRRCLEVFRDFRNPVGIVTKSALVARDVDVLRELAAHEAVHVYISITTLEDELAGRMEPRAARPQPRLGAIETLARAGIPVGVMVAPVIPGLNDAEIPAIAAAAAAAGARSASYVLLRLPRPVDALFAEWVERHYPERRQRILGRIRECREGRMSDARFGSRMRGQGVYAEHVAGLFRGAVRRQGLDRPLPPLSIASFRRPPQPGDQMRLL
jgi:DNA repair photolyase